MDASRLISILTFIAFIILITRLFKKLNRQVYPYRKRKYLLSVPERRFYEWLQVVLPDDVVVIPQVVLSNILVPNVNRRDFWKYQNKINRKTVDFVLFSLPYLEPLVAIEYDGRTHDRPDRRQRDIFVENALRNAGIEIIRIRHSNKLNYKAIEKLLLSTIDSVSS